MVLVRVRASSKMAAAPISGLVTFEFTDPATRLVIVTVVAPPTLSTSATDVFVEFMFALFQVTADGVFDVPYVLT